MNQVNFKKELGLQQVWHVEKGEQKKKEKQSEVKKVQK